MTRHLFTIFSSLLICIMASASDVLSIKTVVIDAGHGGKDPGAVSIDKKTYEKTFTLDIAQRLASKIRTQYPDIRVILTRDTDEFIALDRRAQIANDANADLFISIHINAASNRTANGYSVHVLGESSQKNRDLYASNLEIVKRENSVITLEDGYKTSYNGFDPSNPESYIFMTMMQSAYLQQSIEFAGIITEKLKKGPISRNNGVSQNPFLVLWRTSMPAVLVELGFISNADDLWTLCKSDNREELSQCLLEAFTAYKAEYETEIQTQAVAPDTTATTAPATMLYGTQAFVVSKPIPAGDKRLMGYEPKVINNGTIYKYIIGISYSRQEATESFNKIHAQYPDSYMVLLDGDSISRLK